MILGLPLVCALCGCVPAEFGRATEYYVRRAAVTDAASRRTSSSPYYRFNSRLLADLDAAADASDQDGGRARASQVLRDSNRLARTATESEIDRLPTDAQAALAEAAGVDADAPALKRHFNELADAALQRDLAHVSELPPPKLRNFLTKLRRGVEALPDDRDRRGRQALLLWAALPVAIGIAEEEAKLPGQCAAKIERDFDRIAVWRPAPDDSGSLISRFAPVMGIEAPPSGDEPEYNKIGAVELSSADGEIEVHINTAKPILYAYTSQASIHDKNYQQLNYVWWFPERPAMTEDDPVAGRIDGAMLRITLDGKERPILIESSLNCGCAHEVFVADTVERAASEAFGPPLPEKRFSVEQHVDGKHDIVVVDTFSPGTSGGRPLILVAGGYHEVCQVSFDDASDGGRTTTAEATYDLLDYDALDRLPLGDGVASMFGADGLVHNAGRREGYLLAPSGMLSAGQPRKRGTQRVRWDDYVHDDPHLLELTLRLPPLD